MSNVTGVPIGRSASLAGAHAWSEERLYETLGRSVRAVDDAELKVMLARHASMHAEHAEWFRARLPVLAGVDQEELVAAGSPLIADPDLVGEPGLAAVDAVYRLVLPALLDSYRGHLSEIAEASDAPSARTLRLVIAADEAARITGVATLDRLAGR